MNISMNLYHHKNNHSRMVCFNTSIFKRKWGWFGLISHCNIIIGKAEAQQSIVHCSHLLLMVLLFICLQCGSDTEVKTLKQTILNCRPNHGGANTPLIMNDVGILVICHLIINPKNQWLCSIKAMGKHMNRLMMKMFINQNWCRCTSIRHLHYNSVINQLLEYCWM